MNGLGRILHLTRHARERARLRGISDGDVRTVLVFGEHVAAATYPGRAPRRMARANLRGREAWVVYTQDERRILVISLGWTGEPER